jgi:hypothetical protein
MVVKIYALMDCDFMWSFRCSAMFWRNLPSVFRVEVEMQMPGSSQMLLTIYVITCNTRILCLYNALNPVEATRLIFSFQT